MKTKAILFSTDMVKAIMDGTKTQTRRVLKPTRTEMTALLINMYAGVNVEKAKEELIRTHTVSVGDVFWVRETWAEHTFKSFPSEVYYKAKHPQYQGGWKPSIFMPKRLCRNFLKIKSISIEQVNEISDEDSLKEGIQRIVADTDSTRLLGFRDYSVNPKHGFNTLFSAKDSFESLWVYINGQESWDDNPFVWVYEFEKIDKPPMFDMDKDEFKFLQASRKCLDFFGIERNGEIIKLTDGGNSVIMKSNGRDFSKKMIGHSLNGIAEYVARSEGKKTVREEYR